MSELTMPLSRFYMIRALRLVTSHIERLYDTLSTCDTFDLLKDGQKEDVLEMLESERIDFDNLGHILLELKFAGKEFMNSFCIIEMLEYGQKCRAISVLIAEYNIIIWKNSTENDFFRRRLEVFLDELEGKITDFTHKKNKNKKNRLVRKAV